MRVIVYALSVSLLISTLIAGEAYDETEKSVADARQEVLYFFNKHENKIFFNQPFLDALAKDWAMQAICKDDGEENGLGCFFFSVSIC